MLQACGLVSPDLTSYRGLQLDQRVMLRGLEANVDTIPQATADILMPLIEEMVLRVSANHGTQAIAHLQTAKTPDSPEADFYEQPLPKAPPHRTGKARLISRQHYKAWLVRLKYEVYEWELDLSLGTKKPSKKRYEIYVNLPFFRKLIEYTTFSTGFNSGKSLGLKSYNIIPWESEIVRAFYQLDMAKILDLYSKGLASPYDHDESGRNAFDWLMNRVHCLSRSMNQDREYEPHIYERLIRQLSQCLTFNAGTLRRFLDIYKLFEYDVASRRPMITFIRLILESQVKMDLYSIDYAQDCTMEVRSSELHDILQPHIPSEHEIKQLWYSGEEAMATSSSNGLLWRETDYEIFLDPGGFRFKRALDSGPCVATYEVNGVYIIHSGFLTTSHGRPIMTLLICGLYYQSSHEEIREGCVNRLSAIFDYGYSLTATQIMLNGKPKISSSILEDNYEDEIISISIAEYAELTGASTILNAALKLSRWSDEDIQNLYDTQYDGIKELFSDGLVYITQEEYREQFRNQVCAGTYLDFSGIELLDLVDDLCVHGFCREFVSYWDVCSVIEEANKAYQLETLPGTWPNPDNEGVLQWGKDFDCHCEVWRDTHLRLETTCPMCGNIYRTDGREYLTD